MKPAIPRETLADFCRRNHIRKLALFGSVLSGWGLGARVPRIRTGGSVRTTISRPRTSNPYRRAP